MLNTSLFIRYFIASFLAVGLLVFLSSFAQTTDLDKDVAKLANQYRRSNGRSALTVRDDLNAIAKKHSEDMANGKKSFGHGGFEQRTKQVQRIFPSGTVAENVAYGARDAKEVMTMWKNSTNHRSNLLGDYSHTGIGTARDRQGKIYYTQIFVR